MQKVFRNDRLENILVTTLVYIVQRLLYRLRQERRHYAHPANAQKEKVRLWSLQKKQNSTPDILDS